MTDAVLATSEVATTADHALAEPASVIQHIRLNFLTPSPTNPRKHFDQKALEELAESIRKVTVLQPILARPHPNAKPGAAQFEVVAGERRWRASQLANQPTIPAIVRDLSDFEVLEIQVIENLQRDDLQPLEEAEGFAALLKDPPHGAPRLRGYTIEELAAKLGKSTRYVYARIQLLHLVQDARRELESGTLTASTALLVARMPAELQLQAVKRIKQGWGGEPLSYRNALELVQREFMLNLRKAPFKITDATLLPKAGDCRSCGKRTGANKDLFDDVKSADVCTDPPCFRAKEEAHRQRVVEEAKERGVDVITGKAAKAAMPHQYGSEIKGYVKANDTDYRLGDKPVRKLLGKDCPPIALLENPHTHELIEVVKEEDAVKALKAMGLLKSSRMPTTSSTQRADDAKRKAEAKWRNAAAIKLLEQAQESGFDAIEIQDFLLPELALWMWRNLGNEEEKRCERLLGWDHISMWQDTKGPQKAQERIRALTEKGLAKIFTAMLIAGELSVPTYNPKAKAERLERLAYRLDVDLAPIKAEHGSVAKPAAKKAAKPSPARAAGVSTPPLNAAAQGAKTAPKAPKTKAAQPADATAAFVAAHAPAAAPKTTKAKGKKSQSDKPEASTTNQAKKPRTSTPKAASKKDKPATPARLPKVGERWRRTPQGTDAWPFPVQVDGVITVFAPGDTHATLKLDSGETQVVAIDSLEFLADASAPAPQVGDRWRVRPDVKGRGKTAGREGTVDAIDEECETVTLRWGPKRHEIGVYAVDQVEFVAAAEPKVQLSPVAAWPFPNRPD